MKLQLNSEKPTLHTNLSYRDFFNKYNPFTDGQAFIATYSFRFSNFDFWSKLEPLSVLYVSEKYEREAQAFLQRFPLFEVYSVPKLHTKAIFFNDSGRLLLGSENLYASESLFSELMVELSIAPEQKEEVVQMAFRSLNGKILTCEYGLSDIRLNPDGYPYLPCEKEITYWDLVARRMTPGGKRPDPEFHSPSYIYHLLEYDVGGKRHILAFNRGYAYIGDISVECANWLLENCELTQYSTQGNGIMVSTASDLIDTSPRKDYFLNYHPVARENRATKAYWLGKVKNQRMHEELIEPILRKDITRRKIIHPKDQATQP